MEAGVSAGSVSELDAIGGHGSRAGGVWSMLTRNDPKHGPLVMKPISTEGITMSARGKVEYDFYEELQALGDHPFAAFCPRYYGMETRQQAAIELPYLLLEDITARYSRANIVDLKMGQRTWDPDATEDKRQRELKKYPQQSEIGFRFTGLRVWNADRGEYDRLPRKECLEISVEGVYDVLARFFPDRVRSILPTLIKRLKELEECLISHARWRFYASSLLIVYEGDPSVELTSDSVDVRGIDFAHVFRIEEKEGTDEGYLFGLATLRRHLETLLHAES